jgi:hypothetical protein
MSTVQQKIARHSKIRILRNSAGIKPDLNGKDVKLPDL